MAIGVNTNVASLNAQRNLAKSQGSLQKSIARLSSGLRINSAKDDAAGMAISNKMTAQIRGLNQSVRNANDGIALTQTAESSLQESTNILQRIRELSVQSSSDSNTDEDRAFLQAEVSQLIDELDRISTTTNFNGKTLFDGSFGKATFQVGANVGESFSIEMQELGIDTMGGGKEAGVSALGDTGTGATSGTALEQGDIVLNGTVIGPSLASDDAASQVNANKSAIAKVAAINKSTDETGVVAEVTTTTAAGAAMDGTDGAVSGMMEINGVKTGSISVGGSDLAADRAAVVSAINSISEQTGVVATNTGDDNTGIVLEAEDGRNINVVLDSADTLTANSTGVQGTSGAVDSGTAGTVTYGGYTLRSLDNSAIDILEGSGDITNAGLSEGTYESNEAFLSSSSTTAAIAAGDVIINGINIGASKATDDTASSTGKAGSAIAKVAAINRSSDETGVVATVNATEVAGASMTAAAATGFITINGVDTAGISTTTNAADSRALVVDAINAISGQTGVIAVDTGSDTDGVQLIAENGRNIEHAFDTLTAASTGVGAANTTYATFTLSSAKEITIEASTGTIANTGLEVGTYGGSENGQFIKDVDISTLDGAQAAIEAVDNALSTVNSQRADLGAIQNRLESTTSNLQTVSENLSAARSQLMDADFAAETAAMTRGQILQQAGVSMLAQANQLPQMALSLLQ